MFMEPLSTNTWAEMKRGAKAYQNRANDKHTEQSKTMLL